MANVVTHNPLPVPQPQATYDITGLSLRDVEVLKGILANVSFIGAGCMALSDIRNQLPGIVYHTVQLITAVGSQLVVDVKYSTK